ncbi:sensor histidine kinase [Clostridium cuniculi]|uniref:sensor histidine kinase n=1 Tax=Clostridium cuniculi TaxID=2548455 RepID=UPI00105475A3|nr:PAS domain-containing sensor histidine kinase [Clostridium cuniculi]
MVKNTYDKQRKYTIEDLEEILDKLPYQIWLKDSDGKHIYINKLGAENIGLPKESIIGKTDFEIRDYDMAENCVKTDKILIDKNHHIYNEEYTNIDGQEVCYKVSKFKLERDNNKNYILGGIAEDISLDKNIQLKLENNLLGYLDKDTIEYDSNGFLNSIIENLKKTIYCKEVEAFVYNEDEKKFTSYFSSNEKNRIFDENLEIYINEKIENKLLSNEFQKDRYDDIYDRIVKYQRYNIEDELKIKHIKLSNKLIGLVFIFYDKNNKEVCMDEAFLEQILTKIAIILKQIKNKYDILSIKEEKKKLEDIIELECIKSDFFDRISHEFRTPINIILSVIQLLLSNNNEINNKLNYKSYLPILKQNSYRLLRLVNNSIDAARLSNNFYDLKLKNYNIISVVEDITMYALRCLKETKRNIIFDTDEEEVILACDLDKIEKIILNLISNAIKFSETNTDINVNIRTDLKSEKVFISIRNYGQVIKKEDREIIFGKCTQIDDLLIRRSEGSGVGLFLVRKFAEIHNGGIYIDDLDECTQFTLYLPITCVEKEGVYEREDDDLLIEKCNIEFSDIYL